MEDEFFHYEQTRNGWVAVFQKLQKEAKERAGSQDDARKPMNMIRNRYRDVLPIDKTRVKLNSEDNDYINANLVTIEDVKRSYLLTQGPLQHTCSHFWQMIWEQNTTGILMLNRCYERGMTKCYPYWPQTDDEGVEFGQWRIELLTTEDADSYRLSHLKLINTSNDESRVILHFHYTRWPDFGVPKTPDVFLDFLYAVRNSGVLNEDVGPCVVHCSAGIGRTGTFCLVDICLKKIEEVNEINAVSVQSRLQDMRTQRLGLIQTPDQLRFSYIAVLQGAIQLLHLVNSDSDEEEEEQEEEVEQVKVAESDDSEEETQGPSNGFTMSNGPAISIYGEPDDDDDKPPPIPPRPPDTLPNYHQDMLRHSPSPPSSSSPSPPPPPPPTSLPPGPPVVHTHTNSSDDENQAKRAHLNEDDDEDDDIEEVLMRHEAHTTEETFEYEETVMEERLASVGAPPAVPLHGRGDSKEEEEKSQEDPFLLQGGGGGESDSPLPPPLPPKMYRRDPPGIDDRPPLPLPVEAQQDKREEQALISELAELKALVSQPPPPPLISFAKDAAAPSATEIATPPVEKDKRKDDEPSSSSLMNDNDDIQLATQRRRDQRAERGRRIAEQVEEMKRKKTEEADTPPSVPWLLVTLSLVIGYILYHVWNT